MEFFKGKDVDSFIKEKVKDPFSITMHYKMLKKLMYDENYFLILQLMGGCLLKTSYGYSSIEQFFKYFVSILECFSGDENCTINFYSVDQKIGRYQIKIYCEKGVTKFDFSKNTEEKHNGTYISVNLGRIMCNEIVHDTGIKIFEITTMYKEEYKIKNGIDKPSVIISENEDCYIFPNVISKEGSDKTVSLTSDSMYNDFSLSCKKVKIDSESFFNFFRIRDLKHNNVSQKSIIHLMLNIHYEEVKYLTYTTVTKIKKFSQKVLLSIHKNQSFIKYIYWIIALNNDDKLSLPKQECKSFFLDYYLVRHLRYGECYKINDIIFNEFDKNFSHIEKLPQKYENKKYLFDYFEGKTINYNIKNFKILELLYDHVNDINSGKGWIHNYYKHYMEQKINKDDIIKKLGIIKKCDDITLDFLHEECHMIEATPSSLNHKPLEDKINYNTTSEYYYLENNKDMLGDLNSSEIYCEYKGRCEKDLFVPIVRYNTNVTDILGYDYNDKKDTPFIVAKGIYSEHECYSFDLIFTLMEEYEFSLEGVPINIDEDRNLLYLNGGEEVIFTIIVGLSEYPRKQQLLEMMENIGQKFDDDKAFLMFNKFTVREKYSIRLFFCNLYVIGLKTRRWEYGEDFPYEIQGTLHGDKGISEIDMEVILTQEFLELKEKMDQLSHSAISFINRLETFTKFYQSRDINLSIYKKLIVIINKTFMSENDPLCQRVASNIFIVTSDHYFKLFFGIGFPEFEIEKLVGIQ